MRSLTLMLAKLRSRAASELSAEVKVEDDFCPVNSSRTDEVGVHHTLVPVDHEVRIDPVIESTVALADCGCLLVGFYGRDRARLETKALAGFNRVLGGIENAVQPAVNMWNVITAVEVVINKDLPVAVQRVSTPLHPMEFFKAQLANPLSQIDTQKAFEGWTFRDKLYKYQAFPYRGLNRYQSVRRSVEVANPSKLRCYNEGTVQIVRPAMVGTAEGFEFFLRASS